MVPVIKSETDSILLAVSYDSHDAQLLQHVIQSMVGPFVRNDVHTLVNYISLTPSCRDAVKTPNVDQNIQLFGPVFFGSTDHGAFIKVVNLEYPSSCGFKLKHKSTQRTTLYVCSHITSLTDGSVLLWGRIEPLTVQPRLTNVLTRLRPMPRLAPDHARHQLTIDHCCLFIILTNYENRLRRHRVRGRCLV